MKRRTLPTLSLLFAATVGILGGMAAATPSPTPATSTTIRQAGDEASPSDTGTPTDVASVTVTPSDIYGNPIPPTTEPAPSTTEPAPTTSAPDPTSPGVDMGLPAPVVNGTAMPTHPTTKSPQPMPTVTMTPSPDTKETPSDTPTP